MNNQASIQQASTLSSPEASLEVTSTAKVSKAIASSSSSPDIPDATSAPSPTATAHSETVGRPVARKEISPELQAKIEKNRLAALERRAEHQKKLRLLEALAASDSAFFDANAKAINKAMEEVEPLPKNNWTKFYDYDLSKMKDTRAGFIRPIDEDDPSNPDPAEENERKRKWQPTLVEDDPSVFYGADDNYECQDCTSTDVDVQILRNFQVSVCIGCRDTQPERYSLLTKTECRQDYLLTDPELRDDELFPHWERPNPKKATWNNMILYLRCQVEEFAFKKWGGSEGLDQEFERRERDKEARKELKFKKELRDLRNKTRTSVWQDKKMKNRPKVHQHDFGAVVVDPKTGSSVQTCIECGIQVECEEF
ncbi:hypothetical protein BGW38_000120 [Lunasporangiospora selenospora]|uniref:XPA C-terminal domain-containing protein n=1 Tax=Lunasporangiospora selenospora TaxID=979761 RepID=A0A9P6FWL8_9FUNG|nr:hypothetical protein BGW38_000120 [Lunasporangiospora selenospora]